MNEKNFHLKTKSRKQIYCSLNKAQEKASDKLIIMIHGLCADKSSAAFPMATLEFIKQGYDVLRYDQYSGEENARNIVDCHHDILISDFDDVMDFAKKKYDDIYLIGHSYGGFLVMLANYDDIKAASLWDPTYNLADKSWSEGIIDQYDDRICIRWGNAWMINRKMWDEESTYDIDKCRELGKECKFPIQVIHCGKGILYKYGESYNDYSGKETDYILIKNASHNFDELMVIPELTSNVIKWFNKI